MFEKLKKKREQRIKEAQEKLEQELAVERERLMTLSEKELMIETIMELKKISHQCDDIAEKIILYGN